MATTIARTAAKAPSLVAPKATNAPKAKSATPAKATNAPAPKAHVMKGKLALVRNTAMAGVASLAYAEGKARADVIAQLKMALGAKPTVQDVDALKLEYIVGRCAFKLADSAKPVAEQIAHARAIVTQYAAPPKDGVKARALRAGQLGRRSVEQHKAVRAAEEAWSQIKADMGVGGATTTAERKGKAKRAARVTATNNAPTVGKAGAGVTHSELVKPEGPMDADAATKYIMSMASTLNMFVAKHAGVVPAAYGASVKRFYGAINQAAKDAEALRNTEK